MIEADAGEFGKRDGEDREIDAADAEAKRRGNQLTAPPCKAASDRTLPACRSTARCRNAHRAPPARIGAEPDIERMAERQLPGKAHHDVPGLPDIGEVQNQDQDGQEIVAGKQRRAEQDDQQHGQQD